MIEGGSVLMEMQKTSLSQKSSKDIVNTGGTNQLFQVLLKGTKFTVGILKWKIDKGDF